MLLGVEHVKYNVVMIRNSHCPHRPEPGSALSHRVSPLHRLGPRTPGLSLGPATHSPPRTGRVITVHNMIIINTVTSLHEDFQPLAKIQRVSERKNFRR